MHGKSKSLSPLLQEDYVDVKSATPVGKDRKEITSKTGKEGKKLDGPCKKSGKDSLEIPRVSKVHSGLAWVVSPESQTKTAAIAAACGVDPTADAAIIRRMLLLQRSGLGSTEKSAERKHVYTVGQFGISSTETTVAFSRVVGGTASNTRITNTVGARSLRFRGIIQRTPTAPGTVAALQPVIRYVFWRDKIPASPGTAPTLWGTDANPPASTTLMFSRLGNAAVVHNATAIFNPITALDYHVYEARTMELNDKSTYDYTTPATALGIAAPQVWHLDHKIDFNMVRQNYASYTASAPDVNDLYFTFIADIDYSTQGYTDQLTYSTDMEFEDLQDG